MEEKKKVQFAFQPQNYKLLLIGLGINILGYILMIGGAAEELSTFDESSLFSTTRISIAPIFIVVGFLVIMYSIMKKPKSENK